MKNFTHEPQEPTWVDPGNFLQNVPNKDILKVYDRMALNFRRHEYAMESWSRGGRGSPAWRALLKIQKDNLMLSLMEYRFCDDNIERHPHAHEFARLAREKHRAEMECGMLKRPMIKRKGVYREVPLSDSDSDSDPDSFCEPENGYCSYVEPPMCYLCSNYKRQKRATNLTEPKDLKEEAKPDVKPKATMESTRAFRGKIYHWLKKVETAQVEVKPDCKEFEA